MARFTDKPCKPLDSKSCSLADEEGFISRGASNFLNLLQQSSADKPNSLSRLQSGLKYHVDQNFMTYFSST